jgi:hypothetical protein
MVREYMNIDEVVAMIVGWSGPKPRVALSSQEREIRK